MIFSCRRKLDDTKSVAASLVQGVYLLQSDRRLKRSGHKAVAPMWWNTFNFQCIKVLVDQYDSSIFGAIFEYKPHFPNNNQQGVPPRYVIAIRGTLMKPGTRIRDLYLDIQIPLNGLTRDSRYRMAFQELQALLAHISPKQVWLVGHSLGAAFALQVGKDMAKLGCYIETFLFNPPYTSAPIEKINNSYLKGRIRIAKSLVTAGIYLVKNSNKDDNLTQRHDQFLSLCSWTPYMFVNPKDPICCEYIGHFEHRGKMKKLGLDKIDLLGTKNSLMSMFAGAKGRIGEPPHLIPSASLTKNMINLEQCVLQEAHGVKQWWQPHPHWHSKLYIYEECDCK